MRVLTVRQVLIVRAQLYSAIPPRSIESHYPPVLPPTVLQHVQSHREDAQDAQDQHSTPAERAKKRLKGLEKLGLSDIADIICRKDDGVCGYLFGVYCAVGAVHFKYLHVKVLGRAWPPWAPRSGQILRR
ncbi:hypothetical protein Landi51_04482 [Colletotrichum acutatum]